MVMVTDNLLFGLGGIDLGFVLCAQMHNKLIPQLCCCGSQYP